ncbi:MAG: hypothetical protein EBU08_09435 [Micrococcales bacterium]|nr:hypothetical protein [Micrococcales bacterium]
MFNKFKEFFFGKSKEIATEAPYKVEAPVTNWPFPRASEIAPEPAPMIATAPVKKSRALAKPKAVPAEKPVVLKKPRAKKTPTN